jgi:hypothetical protein
MITFMEFLGKITIGGGAMIPADSIGQQAVSTLGYTGRPNNLSDTLLMIGDNPLNLPTEVVTGLITHVSEKENPICITVNKNTKVYQNIDQYNKIKSKIVPMKSRVKVVFLKNTKDNTLDAYQVQSINFLN